MEFTIGNAINDQIPAEVVERQENKVGRARIVVIGAGGAGNNSITRLMNMGGVKGAKSVIVNTDMQHLEISKADSKILIGYNITEGLGAGGFPEVGKQAAESSRKELREVLKGAHLVFLTCGLGGGTGTGSLPVIAEIAKKEKAIVVATVTTPFDLEKARLAKAEEGLLELKQNADTVIVIDNNKLVDYYPNLPLNQAFAMADELIASMIKGITETITVPSLMNLDFADVKTIMTQGGVAMIGVGESDTQNKVHEAVENALKHPLLDVDYRGANGALIHITGGPEMTLAQVTEAGEIISNSMSPDAQIIWGARVDPDMGGKIRVMTIVTGVHSPNIIGKNNGLGIKMIKAQSPKQMARGLGGGKPQALRELSIDYL